MAELILGLGSNLPHPVDHLQEAYHRLLRLRDLRHLRSSSLYQNAALGERSPVDYVNMVVVCESEASPIDVLKKFQAIECAMGRDLLAPRWSPRVIDIDLLLYGQQHIQTQALTIPHPGLLLRDFVLVPLFELDAQRVLPSGKPLKDCIRKEHFLRLKKIAPPF